MVELILSDSSKEKKKTSKRKINWSEYNESLLLDEAKCYLMIVFFTELASRIKENEQRKGRRKLSLSEFLDIAAARHRTCIYLLP